MITKSFLKIAALGAVVLLCCSALFVTASQAKPVNKLITNTGCANGNTSYTIVTIDDATGQVLSITTVDCNGNCDIIKPAPGGGYDTTYLGTLPGANTINYVDGSGFAWTVTGYENTTAVYTLSSDSVGVVTIGPPPSVANARGQLGLHARNEELSGAASEVSAFSVANTGEGLKISISIDNPMKASFEVFDEVGKLVYSSTQSNLIAGDNELPLMLPSSLPRGTYFVRLSSAGSTETRKIQLTN